MSSHREAPEISKDPVADNTDVYAFVSPNRSETVTLIANFIPLQGPAGGPNFFEFGDDVLYEIHIDNNGDALADLTYQFRFTTEVRNPDTFLYNTGQIRSLDDPNWNRRQRYSVAKVQGRDPRPKILAQNLPSPPVRVGAHSTPNYPALAQAAVNRLSSGETVFAGQRAEGFYVDLGAVFDLLDLRPFENAHIPMAGFGPGPGVDATRNLNVHTIAIQVPKTALTRDGSSPTTTSDPRSIIGVWASASRQKVRVLDQRPGSDFNAGPFAQVSRLANPLFNEVINPMGVKDLWNSLPPSSDSQFAKYVEHPEVAKLLPVLYPGVFPNLAALNASNKPRADLVAILLTGIHAGVAPGFPGNFTGPKQADLLRLNMAVPPAANPNVLGLLGGDIAGFPNGRRVFDDVVTIELRALAGVTYALVDHSFTPDAAAGGVNDGVTRAPDDRSYQATFPYLADPNDGFATVSTGPG
ncbi:MAG: DUF4331 domain-containing protein [Acidimicrobiales bacterium]